MKRTLAYILGAAALVLSSCQEPVDLTPAESRLGITSITASFPNDNREENSFKGEIDHENGLITIVVPYTYPSNSASHLEMSDLTKMKITANLEDNVSVDPPLLFMDLSRDDNYITVTDQAKNKKKYHIIAEIRKSNLCAVLSFKLPDYNIVGIVNEGAKTISIMADYALDAALAEVEISFGASITGTPNPSTTPMAYNEDGFSFTVTAQDEKTSATYVVKVEIPDTLPEGMRYGSEKFLWKIKTSELGFGNFMSTTSFAVISDYIVFNTRGEDMLYIDRNTGEEVGTIEIPFKGSLTNFCTTADSKDNILVCNLTPNAGTAFVVYRIKGVDGTPEEYINYEVPGGASLGRRISVVGDLDGDAIITAPVFQAGPEFYRWTVSGGVLNETPEHITMDIAPTAQWNYNCDICYLDPSDTSSDYFCASYMGVPGLEGSNLRAHLWFDGKNHSLKSKSVGISNNWVPNAVDAVVFNGVGFMATNTVNGFSWGADDMIYLYDLSTESLDECVWRADKGVYGSWVNSSKENGNDYSDVALRVSDDRCYMYLYFFFAGGQCVSLQFDCLKM